MPIELKSKQRNDKCGASYCRKDEELVPVEIAEHGTVMLCEEHFNQYHTAPVEVQPQQIAQAAATREAEATAALAPAPEPPEKAIERAAASEATEASGTLASIRAFTIESNSDYEFATSVLAEIKGHNNRLEEQKTSVTKPMNDAIRTIRGWFAPAQHAYTQAEALLKAKIVEYHAAQEAKRLAALAKIDDAADSGTVTEALATLATAEQPSVAGVTVKDVWTCEIVDASLLPREYLIPNEPAIRKASAAGVEIPGVRRFQVQRVASRSA